MTGSNPLGNARIVQADADGLAIATAMIAAGGCVAVPTETVYGLAADATHAAAVAAIYAAKGRPSFNPLIVHVADTAMARRWAILDPVALRLADAFWPGALTMVLPLRAERQGEPALAPAVTAGLGTVAIRCPAHPVMQALIGATALPLAAPSANTSGAVSPTTAAHVAAGLGARVSLIVDAGPCATGLESTIIAVADDRLTLLRPGPVTADQLTAACGLPVVAHRGDAIIAPGQLSSHYAPGKPMLLDCCDPPADAFVIGWAGSMPCDFDLSSKGNLAEAASRLFDALHRATASAQPRIAVARIPSAGIGLAINDRLRRAAA